VTGQHGGKRHGAGRPKGSPNKATREFKETVSKLLDANTVNMSLWLARVGKKDPAKALDLMSKLAEYAVPKLSRSENTNNVTIRSLSTEIAELNRSARSDKPVD
jgi:hypothetical protein